MHSDLDMSADMLEQTKVIMMAVIKGYLAAYEYSM